MKTKLSPGALWTLIIVGLCILCFIVVPLIVAPDPHAGHDHTSGETHSEDEGHSNAGHGDSHATADDADPHAGHDHATPPTDGHNHAAPSGNGSHDGHNHADAAHNKSAKDSYMVKKQSNGIYTYQVVSRAGHPYASEIAIMTEPTLTVISDDVILVSGRYGKSNNLSGWAYNYNVVGEGTVGAFDNYVLAATENKVAYLEKDGDSPFRVVVCNPFNTAEATRTDLPGLAIAEGGNPVLDYALLDNGTLQVTYKVGDTEKVVDVKMN